MKAHAEISESVDGDCPVVLISHEGPCIEAEWPSVAAFLDDTVAQYEKISPAKLKKIRKEYSI